MYGGGVIKFNFSPIYITEDYMVGDLINKRFKKLVILDEFRKDNNTYCHCRCDCGRELDILKLNIKSKKQVSCGKCKEPSDFGIFQDLTNKPVGDLFVIEYLGKSRWRCRCSCGNEVIKSSTYLHTHKDANCGCKNIKIPENKDFGDFIILDKHKRKNKKTFWLCRCKKCGLEKYMRIDSASGRTHNCIGYTKYPQWFVDELSNDSDKVRANNGSMRTSEVVKFHCDKHGDYDMRVYAKVRIKTQSKLQGCPMCCGDIAHIGSKSENEIKDIVEKLSGKKFVKSRVLDGKEIDLYCEELKLGIEYCGSAFHASKNGIYGNKNKYYHRDKFLLAKSKGIHLITIFDKDWEENRDEIIERLKTIICGDRKFFIPKNSIEYTDNDYDDGKWLDEYIEDSQEEPDSFTYGNNYVVYRCGRTKWRLKDGRAII